MSYLCIYITMNTNKYKNLWHRYKLTKNQYDSLLESQGHCCLTCGTHESKAMKGMLFVDHNHKTKRIRGLLCNKCNLILAHCNEDISILENISEYIKSEGSVYPISEIENL